MSNDRWRQGYGWGPLQPQAVLCGGQGRSDSHLNVGEKEKEVSEVFADRAE